MEVGKIQVLHRDYFLGEILEEQVLVASGLRYQLDLGH